MTSGDADKLVMDAVKDHYAESDSPFYLSELGVFFRSNDIEIPTGVRFKDYLVSRFHNRLSVVQDPDVPAKIAITLPGHESAVIGQLAGHGSELESESGIDFSRLPLALVAAFCKIPLPNTRVYFRITTPFRYETLMIPPDGDYVEIEDAFRPLSLAGRSICELSLIEKQTIYDCIVRWANVKSIDLRKLYYDYGQQHHGRKVSGGTSQNALQRLISAQDPELRERIQIPGDIASTLMRLP